MSSDTAAGEEKNSAAVDDVVSSSITGLSQQSSDSSSQAPSSQENVLQCSEALVSSTPLVASQGNSQLISAGELTVSQEINVIKDRDTQGASSDIGLSKGSSEPKANLPSALPFTPEKTQQAPASNGFQYSPGFMATSNLSQLAELAANKCAMNQMSSNSVQQPIQPQVLGSQSRFVIPSQGIPPGMFGAYPSAPMVQYQGFSPAPSAQVPSPFVKGSIIQLTSGDLKRVEDLTTEDFINSIKLYPDHNLDTSTVVKVEDGTDAGCTHITFTINSSKKQVTLNCPVEHPFFVYGQGWTSCRPDQSLVKYNLTCQHLKVGDVCIFLSPSPVGVTLSSGPTTQVVAAKSGGTSVPVKSVASASSSSHLPSPVTVSYAQTLAGMAALPGNIPGVVVTSSLAPGIPAMYQGNFPTPQGKVTAQSGGDCSQTAQPVQGLVYTADGKPLDPQHSTSTVPGGFSIPGTSYYQPLPGTIMTAVPPGQTFVQGTVMPQGSVGNGLLVAAVGFVPGRPPQFVQPGMLYAPPQMEIAPKASDAKPEEYPNKGRTDSQAELAQPDAKRMKAETEVK